MATIRGGSCLIDRNLNLHFVFTSFWAKTTWEKSPCENGFFHGFFPAHGFGNPQTYKIQNTGVDGPCPCYKIKNIAFEQKKHLGLWMSFGFLLGVFCWSSVFLLCLTSTSRFFNLCPHHRNDGQCDHITKRNSSCECENQKEQWVHHV